MFYAKPKALKTGYYSKKGVKGVHYVEQIKILQPGEYFYLYFAPVKSIEKWVKREEGYSQFIGNTFSGVNVYPAQPLSWIADILKTAPLLSKDQIVYIMTVGSRTRACLSREEAEQAREKDSGENPYMYTSIRETTVEDTLKHITITR